MIKINTNRKLFIEDIYKLYDFNFKYVKREDFNWILLWKNKIDQVEYFVISNYKKLDIYTLAIINYYICLAELAVNFFNNNVNYEYITLTLCHKRIRSNYDLYEYYSVTDLILDHFTRDIGEYVKNDIYNDRRIDVSSYKLVKELNFNDINMVIARVLFPSYFFDLFDDFILNDREFNGFAKYFINIDVYESNLRDFVHFLAK